jgi:hypothetical protein
VGDTVSVGSGSDTDGDKEVVDINEEESDDNIPPAKSLGWKLDTPFHGVDKTKRFQQVLKTQTN